MHYTCHLDFRQTFGFITNMQNCTFGLVSWKKLGHCPFAFPCIGQCLWNWWLSQSTLLVSCVRRCSDCSGIAMFRRQRTDHLELPAACAMSTRTVTERFHTCRAPLRRSTQFQCRIQLHWLTRYLLVECILACCDVEGCRLLCRWYVSITAGRMS